MLSSDIFMPLLSPHLISCLICFLFSRSDMLQETHLLDEDSSSESQTDEEAFLDVVADIIDLSDKTISIEDV